MKRLVADLFVLAGIGSVCGGTYLLLGLGATLLVGGVGLMAVGLGMVRGGLTQ